MKETKLTVTVEVRGLCANCHKSRINDLKKQLRSLILKQIKELEKEMEQ